MMRFEFDRLIVHDSARLGRGTCEGTSNRSSHHLGQLFLYNNECYANINGAPGPGIAPRQKNLGGHTESCILGW